MARQYPASDQHNSISPSHVVLPRAGQQAPPACHARLHCRSSRCSPTAACAAAPHPRHCWFTAARAQAAVHPSNISNAPSWLLAYKKKCCCDGMVAVHVCSKPYTRERIHLHFTASHAQLQALDHPHVPCLHARRTSATPHAGHKQGWHTPWPAKTARPAATHSGKQKQTVNTHTQPISRAAGTLAIKGCYGSPAARHGAFPARAARDQRTQSTLLLHWPGCRHDAAHVPSQRRPVVL